MKPWKIAAAVIAVLFIYLLVRAYFERPALEPIPTVEQTTVTVGLPKFLEPSTHRGIDLGFSRVSVRFRDIDFQQQSIVGNTERIRQKLRLDLSRGNAPDLILVKGTWLSEFLADGFTKPFVGVDTRTESEWLPAFVGLRDAEGERYAIPFDADLRVIWYRRDLFEAAGLPEPGPSWTVDEFVRAARALTADTDGDGRVDRWGFGVPMIQAPKTAAHWVPWYLSLGGPLRPGRTGDEAAGPKALALFSDLINRWKVSPASLVSADQQTVFEGLAGGLYAMAGGGSWEYRMLAEQSEYAGEFRAAPIPTANAGDPVYTVCEGWHWMLTTDDPVRAEAATRLAVFLAGPDVQTPKWEVDHLLPVDRRLYVTPEFSRDPVAARFAELSRRAIGVPSTPYLRTDVAAAIATAIQSVVLGETDPDAAWKTVAEAAGKPDPGSLSAPGDPATVDHSSVD